MLKVRGNRCVVVHLKTASAENHRPVVQCEIGHLESQRS